MAGYERIFFSIDPEKQVNDPTDLENTGNVLDPNPGKTARLLCQLSRPIMQPWATERLFDRGSISSRSKDLRFSKILSVLFSRAEGMDHHEPVGLKNWSEKLSQGISNPATRGQVLWFRSMFGNSLRVIQSGRIQVRRYVNTGRWLWMRLPIMLRTYFRLDERECSLNDSASRKPTTACPSGYRRLKRISFR